MFGFLKKLKAIIELLNGLYELLAGILEQLKENNVEMKKLTKHK